MQRSAKCSQRPEDAGAAYAARWAITTNGAVLVCDRLGGVTEFPCKEVKEAGGTTVGILPGTEEGNPYLDISIRTGLGIARNILVVLSADAVIAVGGTYCTQSEIAITFRTGRPVYGINAKDIEDIFSCTSPEEAVTRAVQNRGRSPPA